MKRNSFVFFSSYYDAIKNLPENEQGQFYKILVEYILVGKQPKKLSSTSKACFLLVKPFLDNSAKRYDANVENGKKGGRPKKENTQSKTQTKPNENPSITQQKPKDNPNETQQKPKQNLNRIEKNRIDIEIYKENNNIKEKNNLENKNDEVVVEQNKTTLDILLNKNGLLQQKYVEKKEMFVYLENLFKRVNQETSFIIKNNTYTSEQILKHFENLFVGSDNQIIDRFVNILMMISNATNISNRFKYTVSVMYQQATNTLDNVEYKPTSKDSFIHNNYTSEQIASLIADLDNTEV